MRSIFNHNFCKLLWKCPELCLSCAIIGQLKRGKLQFYLSSFKHSAKKLPRCRYAHGGEQDHNKHCYHFSL